jgi:hypothetical protein
VFAFLAADQSELLAEQSYADLSGGVASPVGPVAVVATRRSSIAKPYHVRGRGQDAFGYLRELSRYCNTS